MMEPPALHEELQLLGRILREELFRFVLAEYNHRTAIQQAEDFVRKTYPKRPILSVRIKGSHFRRFSQQIKDFKRGIVFIPDFDELFRPENDDFRIAFNQRRDWLAQQPIALIAFLPAGGLQTVMKGMPDFWSRRDAELSLLVNLPERSSFAMQEPRISSIGGIRAAGKTAELQRLRAEIAAADPDNFSQLDNLYRQLLPLLQDIGDYKAGLAAARDYHRLAQLHDDADGGVPSLLYAHDRLAAFHQHLGQYVDADLHARKALELAEKIGDEAVIAEAQNNLALVLKELGHYQEAKALLEKALKSYEQNLGTGHPDTAVAYANLALILLELEDYQEAKALFENTMGLMEQNLGADHPDTAVIYSNLALVLQAMRDYQEAKALLEKALKSNEQNLGADHPNTAVTYSNLALALQALGDYQGAKVLLEKATASNEQNLGPDHPYTAVTHLNLATVFMALKAYDKARPLLEKAQQVFLSKLGADHPYSQELKSWIAELDALEGKKG